MTAAQATIASGAEGERRSPAPAILSGEEGERRSPAPAQPAPRLVPLGRLHPSPLNPRRAFDPAALAELADSICAQGVLQNLIVRPRPGGGDEFEIAAGERRWRAARLAVADGRLPADFALPVAVRALDDDSVVATGLAENAARHDLRPLEEARAYRRLRAAGAATEHIARLAGRSQRHVQLRLDLLQRLAPEGLAALEAGAITPEQARELCRAPGARQKDLLPLLFPKDPEDEDGGAVIQNAAQLRAAVREKMLPLANALFPPTAYAGASVEDDQGRPCADDVVLFRRLQHRAVAARRRELAAQWPWVDVKLGRDEWELAEGRDPPWPYARQPKAANMAGRGQGRTGASGTPVNMAGRGQSRAGVGALILVARDSLRVAVHAGVIDRERQRRAAEKTPARAAAPAGKVRERFDPFALERAVRAVHLAAIRSHVAAGGGGAAARLAAAVASLLNGYAGDEIAGLGAAIGAAVHPAALDKTFLALCGPGERAAMAKELGVELKGAGAGGADALLAAARRRKDYVPAMLAFKRSSSLPDPSDSGPSPAVGRIGKRKNHAGPAGREAQGDRPGKREDHAGKRGRPAKKQGKTRAPAAPGAGE